MDRDWGKIFNALFWTLLALLVGVCIYHTSRTNLDFKVFHTAAVRFLRHDYLNYYYMEQPRPLFTYLYSPSFPALIAPLGWLSEFHARVLWGIASALAFPFAWLQTERLIKEFRPATQFSPLARLVTLIMFLDPVIWNAIQGNINALLLALMASALLASRRQRWLWAGLLAGLATGIKLTPGVVLIAFFLSREWRAWLAGSLFTIFFLVVLPVLLYGVHDSLELVHAWRGVLGRTDFFPFYQFNNQSPLVVFSRWFNDGVGHWAALAISLGVLASALFFAERKNTFMVYMHAFFMLLTWSPVVWIQYHMVMLMPLLFANTLFFSGALNVPEKAWWWLRLILVNATAGIFWGYSRGRWFLSQGVYLWGLIALLVLLDGWAWRTRATEPNAQA